MRERQLVVPAIKLKHLHNDLIHRVFAAVLPTWRRRHRRIRTDTEKETYIYRLNLDLVF